MIKSMTGYGRYEVAVGDIKLIVEMKSVNHRFLEISVRLPRDLLLFEDKIKKIIQEKVSRGRVDVYITVSSDTLVKKKLHIDLDLVKAYLASFQALREEVGIFGNVEVKDLLGIPDLFQVEEEETDINLFRQVMNEGVLQATHQFLIMREAEGEALAIDLKMRILLIEKITQNLIEYAPLIKEHYRSRIENRVREFLENRVEIDEGKILNEVAIFAEKSNIDEELTRLISHCQQFLIILDKDEPVGRKLDFLIQEMNREVNTIGSKANDIRISQQAVELKSELEKIKEQVQNIE
jgi:uncharacterized protein (TIGR00255 family)